LFIIIKTKTHVEQTEIIEKHNELNTIKHYTTNERIFIIKPSAH